MSDYKIIEKKEYIVNGHKFDNNYDADLYLKVLILMDNLGKFCDTNHALILNVLGRDMNIYFGNTTTNHLEKVGPGVYVGVRTSYDTKSYAVRITMFKISLDRVGGKINICYEITQNPELPTSSGIDELLRGYEDNPGNAITFEYGLINEIDHSDFSKKFLESILTMDILRTRIELKRFTKILEQQEEALNNIIRGN